MGTLARVVQEHLKKPLAELLLFGELAEGGGTVKVSAGKDGLSLKTKPASKPAQKPVSTSKA